MPRLQLSPPLPGVGLNAPSGTPSYGSTVRLTGFLAFTSGAPATANVTISGDGSTHAVAVQGLGGGSQSGEFTYALRNIARKVTLRATYQSDASQLPAAPVTVSVTPTALLSRPVLKVIRATSLRIPLPSLNVSGVLKPRHKAGSTAVVLQVWGNQAGLGWKLIKTVKAHVHDRNGASAYSVQVMDRISLGWFFKIKAVHADADHARTESAFSAVVGTGSSRPPQT